MKKTILMLLVVIMSFSVVAYAGVAYAETNTGYSRPAALLDNAAFNQLVPQEQYEYLMSLGSEEEINQLLSQLSDEQLEQLLSTLNDEQLAVLEKYLTQRAADAEASDLQGDQLDESQPSGEEQDTAALPSEQPSPSEAQSGDKDSPETQAEEPAVSETAPAPENSAAEEPAVSETAPAPEGAAAEEPAVDYSAMTPQELYDYLCTVDDAECERILALLTPEQSAALEAYMLNMDQTEGLPLPAVNYTHAAPFLDPVNIVLPKALRQMAAKAAAVPTGEQEDALVVNKTVSGTNGSYLLNIEAYATGEVSITTGETPVPADVILVLDVSRTMGYDMSTGAYTPVTYNTNSEAYRNRSGLFVKVDDQYYTLTITRNNNNYTYSYTIGTNTVTVPGGGQGSRPPTSLSYFRYSEDTIRRIDALKSAANNFIDSIETKANAGTGVDHRIAVVAYSTNASIIPGGISSQAFVNAHNNEGGLNTLQNAINNLSPVEYTSADYGLQRAADIFRDDLPDSGGPRNRVVVFFTDGAPSRGNAGAFQLPVANLAVAAAKSLKAPTSQSGYDATVYSIGIFDEADPTESISGTSDENKFMHLVSSNYPNATSMTDFGSVSNTGYYLSASSASGLNSIFQSISHNIETGGTSVTLDEDSVIKDMIAPYFKLPDGVDADGIRVYTSSVNPSNGTWLTPQAFAGTVSISEDRRTISVSGFDYKDNYFVAVKNAQGEIVEYRGKKLIFTIPIDYIEHSCLGGMLPTNLGTSGIYDQNVLGQEVLVKALPIPTVPIPVQYDFTPVDRSVYLLQSVRLTDLFTNAQSYYIPNGFNNAFVDIEYTIRDAENNLLGTYAILSGEDHGTWNPADPALTGLTENGIYTINCTVTPISTEITPASMTKQAHVYVFKPEITYRDSTIYLGETADYSDNFVQTEWKNSETNVLPQSGSEPVLSFSYSPAEGAFETDTYVSSTVRLNGTNVTGYSTFVHEPYPGCAFDPSDGQFIVHVKSCSITVFKSGAVDETDTFVFTISNGSGLEIKVTMQGNGSQTIVGLPVGEYTVTEVPEWSWRYAADSETVTLSSANTSGEVRIVNHIDNDKWLSGDDRAANLFDGSC